MNEDTVKLQFTIPRVLSDALRVAASNDLRTRQAYLIRLLQECPAIKLCIPKNAKTTVAEVGANAPSNETAPNHAAKTAAEWRP